MARIEHLRNKIERLSKSANLNEKVESIVYMYEQGEILWEEGVKYNFGFFRIERTFRYPQYCWVSDEVKDQNAI